MFNRLYREYFRAPFPARTTITHCLTQELRYEIDCVAVIASPP
jgi:2-iminobutanoate/2-iminopropanoate deaminase